MGKDPKLLWKWKTFAPCLELQVKTCLRFVILFVIKLKRATVLATFLCYLPRQPCWVLLQPFKACFIVLSELFDNSRSTLILFLAVISLIVIFITCKSSSCNYSIMKEPWNFWNIKYFELNVQIRLLRKAY